MKLGRRFLFVTLALALVAGAVVIALISNPFQLAPAVNAPAVSVNSAVGLSRKSVVTPDRIAAGTQASGTPPDAGTAVPSPTAAPTEVPPLPPPTPPAISSEAYLQGMLLRRNGDYAHAAESFRAALAEKPDPSSAREIQSRLGESSWLAGDLNGAAQSFNTLLAQNSNANLAARAHYFLADIFTQRKSYAQAIEHLRSYRAQTRSLMGEIDAEIADVYVAEGKLPQAIAQYDVALQDQTLTASQRADFLERIAAAQSTTGHPGLAAARLSEAFLLAPDNLTRAEVEYKWGIALDAANERSLAVTHWQHALVAYPDQNGAYESLVALLDRQVPVDDYVRGLADYYAKSYDPSIMAFNRYIAANPKDNAAALYYVGLAYLETGQARSAVTSFDSLLQNYPKDHHSADALYYKAQAYISAADTDKAVSTYGLFVARYPTDPRADDALWKAAQSLEKDDRPAEARTQYQALASKYPSSPQAPTSLFSIGLDYYLSQDYANAAANWNMVAKLYPNSAEADRALFWLGKVANSQGDTATAQTYFKQAASAPFSYYGWRSLDVLQPTDFTPSYDIADYSIASQPNDKAKFEEWLAGWNKGGAVSTQLGSAVLSDFHFRRGSELAQLDRAAEARLEFQKVNSRFRGDARALYSLAEFYKDNNYFDLSVAAAMQIQALSGVTSETQQPRYLRALIYPTYYADLIVPYAQRNGVDPLLIFALVRQESTFNPLAKSWVGAMGLTQVMPPTGSGIARDLGIRGFQQGTLLLPYVSIRFGTYFFGQLARYFDGNILYALGGYNAGPGNAKKWVRADVDLSVEAITLPESSLYVRTVYSQYNQYLAIYRGKPQ